MPKGKQFNFGKYQEFGRRLEKLIDVFSLILQLNLLESWHIDGLQDIIIVFRKLFFLDFQK